MKNFSKSCLCTALLLLLASCAGGGIIYHHPPASIVAEESTRLNIVLSSWGAVTFHFISDRHKKVTCHYRVEGADSFSAVAFTPTLSLFRRIFQFKRTEFHCYLPPFTGSDTTIEYYFDMYFDGVYNKTPVFKVTLSNQAALPDDSTTSRLLVGTWSVPKEFATDVVLDGAITLNSDGSFISYGVILLDGEHVRIDVEGTWKVVNGILVEKTTKSSNPKSQHIGMITQHTILSATDKEFRYQMGNKQVTFERRAADENFGSSN